MEMKVENVKTNVPHGNLNKPNIVDDYVNKIQDIFYNPFNPITNTYNNFEYNLTLTSPFSKKIDIIHDYKFVLDAIRGYSFKKTPTELAPDKKGKYSDFNVAIIDDFDMKTPLMLNIPHGKLVRKFITENLPGVKIEEKKVKNGANVKEINEQFKAILREINEGKKYDAINLSMTLLIPPLFIEDFKAQVDNKEIDITNENINNYRSKLMELYKKQYPSEAKNFSEWTKPYYSEEKVDEEISNAEKYANEIFETMKKISDKGIKIFLANNNHCEDALCFSDLIDLDPDYENCNNPNIITVSAEDSVERNTPLSDIKEQSVFYFNKVKNGIDITGDGIADIYDKYGLCDFAKKELNIDKLEGNSFATPTALAKYLKEQADKKVKN